eukprot:s2619_g10.t1
MHPFRVLREAERGIFGDFMQAPQAAKQTTGDPCRRRKRLHEHTADASMELGRNNCSGPNFPDKRRLLAPGGSLRSESAVNASS